MGDPGPSPFKYHLELTPAQLKLTHDALRELQAGLDEKRVEARRVIDEVLEMLPEEHVIAAIRGEDDGGPDAPADPDDAPDRPEPPDLLA